MPNECFLEQKKTHLFLLMTPSRRWFDVMYYADRQLDPNATLVRKPLWLGIEHHEFGERS